MRNQMTLVAGLFVLVSEGRLIAPEARFAFAAIEETGRSGSNSSSVVVATWGIVCRICFRPGL